MQFCVYSRKYLDVAAVYGQQLTPYRDSWASMEKRAVVINLETIDDFTRLRESIGHDLQMDGSTLMICDAPVSLEAYLARR